MGIISLIIVWLILIAGSCKAYPSTYVEGDNFNSFKYLNITMEKYVFHSYFHDIDMDEVYIILERPWMKSIGIINIIAQNYFMNLSYKKKKITLHEFLLLNKKDQMWQ